jgi:hypothetical protein
MILILSSKWLALNILERKWHNYCIYTKVLFWSRKKNLRLRV